MTDRTDDGDAWEGDELINTASGTAPQEMNSPSETDPLGLCYFHTGSTHKWGQCSKFHANLWQSGGTFDVPAPETTAGDTTSNINLTDQEPEAPDRAAKLLCWYYRLGHLLFSKLILLAKLDGD